VQGAAQRASLLLAGQHQLLARAAQVQVEPQDLGGGADLVGQVGQQRTLGRADRLVRRPGRDDERAQHLAAVHERLAVHPAPAGAAPAVADRTVAPSSSRSTATNGSRSALATSAAAAGSAPAGSAVAASRPPRRRSAV
jgi:glutathione S-transferase